MLNVSLEDIMSEHPIKVRENVHVGDVAHLLLRHQINGILVVNTDDENQLAGICTTTDLLKFMDEALSKGAHKIEELKKASEIPVGRIARKDIQFLQRGEKVAKAVAIMHTKNIHTIPIYEKDKLVGVVGRHDILNVAFN